MCRVRRLCWLWLWSAAELCAAWRIAGSDLLAEDFSRDFRVAAEDAGLEVSLDFTGSHHGWRALEAGRADVALLSFAPGQNRPTDPWHCLPLAYQAVAVVVSAALPLAQVEQRQLAGIFAATGGAGLRRWGELGPTEEWLVREIVPLVPDATGSAAFTRVLARQLLLEGRDFHPLVTATPSPQALLAQLEREPGGIGLIPWPLPLDERFRLLAVGADQHAPAFLPTPENIHRGDYGLRWPLWLVFRREQAPQLLPLLRQLYGDKAAAALEKARFSPLPVAVRRQVAFDLEVLK
jgi:ABC-type phosphate transport system substrate-binding protein